MSTVVVTVWPWMKPLIHYSNNACVLHLCQMVCCGKGKKLINTNMGAVNSHWCYLKLTQVHQHIYMGINSQLWVTWTLNVMLRVWSSWLWSENIWTRYIFHLNGNSVTLQSWASLILIDGLRSNCPQYLCFCLLGLRHRYLSLRGKLHSPSELNQYPIIVFQREIA